MNTTIETPSGHPDGAGTITLEGDGLSFISENTARKEALLTPLPLYENDSDATDVFDFGGVIKTVNISGIHIATSKANAKGFIDDVEALIQGAQDVASGYPLEFIDDFRGTIKVKVMDFESVKERGEPLIVRWQLKLVQGSISA